MAAGMKKALHPQFLVPTILGVALLAALLAFGDVKKVVGVMASFNRMYIVYIVLLTIVYEAIACVQWELLLHALKVDIPLRAQTFSFLVGEIGRGLPIGNYLKSYLLYREEGADLGLLSAPSLVIVLIDVAVSLAGVVVIGIPGFPWLRYLIVGGLAIFGIAVFALWKLHRDTGPPEWMTKRKQLRDLLEELRRFEAGTAALMRPDVLGVATALGAAYLVVGGLALYVVLIGLGVGNVSVPEALVAYFFSLAFALIFPLPIDIGVIEASGIGVFLAMGVSREAAVGTVLVNRVLSIGSAIVIAAVGMAVFREDLKKAMAENPDDGDEANALPSGDRAP